MGSGRVSLQRKKDFCQEMSEFRDWMRQTISDLGFAPGSRSWCYLLEDAHIITKGDFAKATKWLSQQRKEFDLDGNSLIPFNFVAADDARSMSGADIYDKEETAREYVNRQIREMQEQARMWWPVSFWDHQQYYPILWTEKADLVKLFEPAMPRAVKRFTGKGWADINSRVEVMREVAWARSKCLSPVLLYCGDHDPVGLQISDTIRSNLEPIAAVLKAESDHPLAEMLYSVGTLKVRRFGLNTDFIEEHDLLWIDGLETSSGKDLADPNHRDHNKPHVQKYLEVHGARKVEANALITRPEAARQLIEEVLSHWIDEDGVAAWEAANQQASEEATEAVEQFVRVCAFMDAQGWLYSGHKVAAAAEIHRSRQLPSGPDVDV